MKTRVIDMNELIMYLCVRYLEDEGVFSVTVEEEGVDDVLTVLVTSDGKEAKERYLALVNSIKLNDKWSSKQSSESLLSCFTCCL